MQGSCSRATDLQEFRSTHDHPGKGTLLVLGHVLEERDVALLLDILLR